MVINNGTEFGNYTYLYPACVAVRVTKCKKRTK